MQWIEQGSFDNMDNVGREKAAVLPEPVYEFIITLFPLNIEGIASY